jgi:hypothetical protein
MYGDRRKPLTILLLIALLVLAGVAYWKLIAKPQLGPYGAIAMSDTSLTYGGPGVIPTPSRPTNARFPNATRSRAAMTAWSRSP